VLVAAAAALYAQTAQPPAPARSAAPRPAPRTAADPSWKDLKFPPMPPTTLPNFQFFMLSNGLRVCLWEDHELPLVDGMVFVRTGSIYDPPDKIGLAAITGMLMRAGGAGGRTGEQLDDELENAAARVDMRVGEGRSALLFSALKENADQALATAKAVLTAPSFQQDKIEPLKNQLRNAIARRNDDARLVARRELTGLVYGGENPYGWKPEYATIDRIQRSDIEAFWRRYFFPANTLLALRGDFDAAGMKSRLETLFADWKAKQDPVTNIPRPGDSPNSGVYLAMKNAMNRTFFALGEPANIVKDPDYAALSVMNAVIAGGPRSQMVQRLRGKGITEVEISANWNAGLDHQGIFEITGATQPRSAIPVIRTIREEIERVRTSEVSEDELRAARESVLNRMLLATDTKPKLFEFLISLQLAGYPTDFLQEFRKNVAAVTRADVLRVSKAHVDPGRLAIVIVGTADDFPEPLSVLGTVTPIPLTIDPPKPEAAKATSANVEKGKQLLDRAQRAVGGAERLLAVRDVIQQTEYKFVEGAGGAAATENDRWISPAYYRQEVTLPSGWLTVYYDGQYGWIANKQGSGPLTGDQLRRVQGDAFRVFFRLLLSDRIEGRVLNGVDDNVLEISDAGGQSARLVLNRDSGLPEKLLYETVPLSGPSVWVEEDWADFHDVAGMKLPFRGAAFHSGKKVADFTISYQLNAGLKSEELIKRP